MNSHFAKTCAILILICCLFVGNGVVAANRQVTEGGLTNPIIRTGVRDTNGKTIIGLTATSSAVNYPNFTNSATGNDPLISAAGTDGLIATFGTSGTGYVTLHGNGVPSVRVLQGGGIG